MVEYDPLEAPDPAEWLALDEAERIELAAEYHRRAREKLPNLTVHAAMHAIVENQIAMGDEIPICRTVERLEAEGLNRHEAVHAIGSVLAGYMYDAIKGGAPEGDPNQKYWAALEKLTAKSWRRAR